MDFLLDSQKKKTSFVYRLQIMTWSAHLFPFPFFFYNSAPGRLKKGRINSFSLSVAFHFPCFSLHLLRVVLTFKQNKAFGGIIIILPYPLQDLSNLPTLIGHFFPQPTLKGNSPILKSILAQAAWFNSGSMASPAQHETRIGSGLVTGWIGRVLNRRSLCGFLWQVFNTYTTFNVLFSLFWKLKNVISYGNHF